MAWVLAILLVSGVPPQADQVSGGTSGDLMLKPETFLLKSTKLLLFEKKGKFFQI